VFNPSSLHLPVAVRAPEGLAAQLLAPPAKIAANGGVEILKQDKPPSQKTTRSCNFFSSCSRNHPPPTTARIRTLPEVPLCPAALLFTTTSILLPGHSRYRSFGILPSDNLYFIEGIPTPMADNEDDRRHTGVALLANFISNAFDEKRRVRYNPMCTCSQVFATTVWFKQQLRLHAPTAHH